ncbi:MAG TPA: C1 family peptidase [Sumerlaeia bacterium]|nr:C1 family peptidase [Sumerlaeia bacterium]
MSPSQPKKNRSQANNPKRERPPRAHPRTQGGHLLDAASDVPDIRDRMYEPTLRTLAYPAIEALGKPTVLDQGRDGSCTGFALAAVINLLMAKAGREKGNARGTIQVSGRMLYQMAKLHDEWPGDDYEGSSLRGAIKGWHNTGVCRRELWPDNVPANQDTLDFRRAVDARNHTLGAYYRLRPSLPDFHAALNETGVLYVSAQIHQGWERADSKGVIKPDGAPLGRHAFAIVGYDKRGFWVQNSWGKSWGKNGLGLWTYEDWVQNMMDAWVVQLAMPTPQVFGLRPRMALAAGVEVEARRGPAPRRHEILGHFVYIDDGRFEEKGRYWSNADVVRETAEHVARSAKYDHLVIYAHGGLNGPEDSARRIFALKDGFRRNGVYPFHVMYDTGLAEETKDLVVKKFDFFKSRAAGFLDCVKELGERMAHNLADRADRILEGLTRRPGTLLWKEMKKDARVAFEGPADSPAGVETLRIFLEAFANGNGGVRPKKIHMAGHSTGGVLLAHLLEATRRLRTEFEIESVSLLAPACRVELFRDGYVPALKGGHGGARVRKLNVYNLTDELERADNVAGVYRKSLLYLVSNAFEEEEGAAIAGMERFKRRMPKIARLDVIYSRPDSSHAPCRSKSHGGFDNDPATMNDILKTILGRKPAKPFTTEELAY